MTERHATEAPGPEDMPGYPQDPHGDADTHVGDDHRHDDESLGPINVAAWGAGALGIAIAVVIAACFVLATSGIG